MKSVVMGTMALAMTASASLAADLPSRREAPVFVAPVVDAFTWTGVELGLHSSYTFGSNNSVRTTGRGTPAGDTRPAYLKTEKSGFANLGAGFGYNYQFNPGPSVVIGASFDADWVALSKNAYYLNAPGPLSIYHQRLTYLGTANGKLGYSFGRLLVYGTGGFAFGDPGVGGVFKAPGSNTNRYIGGNDGNLRGGYNFGGGFAYAIPESSFLNKFAFEKIIFERLLGVRTTSVLKVEYIHYNLGTQNITLNNAGGGAGGSYALRYKTEGNQVRAGLTYLIGGAPTGVVARY